MKTAGKGEIQSKRDGRNEQEESNLPFYYKFVLIGLNTPVSSILLVSKPEFIIGCAPDCDAILYYSKEISRHHACISCSNGLYTIKDLKSTNFTFLNGETLVPDQSYTISNGDQVTFASYTYEIKEIRF